MNNKIDKILFSEDEIKQKVRELGAKFTGVIKGKE